MPEDISPPDAGAPAVQSPGSIFTQATPPPTDPGTPPPDGQTAPPPAEVIVPDSPPPATPWQSTLPESFRTTPALAVFTGLESREMMIEKLGEAYAATKALVGSKLERPTADSSPEAWNHWRKINGAPEKPEDYGDLKPSDLPEEYWDKSQQSEFQQLFHDEGASPAFVAKLKELHGKHVMEALKGAEATTRAEVVQEEQKLRQQWGQSFDRNFNAVKGMLEAPDIKFDLDHPALRHSEVVDLLAKIHNKYAREDTTAGRAAAPSPIAGNASSVAADIQDPASQSRAARAYRGDFGTEEQSKAQQQLHAALAQQSSGRAA